MNEYKTIKILIIFSLILLITGGFLFWNQGWLTSQDKINQISLLKLISKLAGFSGEKTYLLLFQNNLELRPSGGYIGNFGIIKIKNGKPITFETHDTNIFDGFGKIQTEPPQSMKDYLGIINWQMRDGNWSPDFKISAEQVEYFYRLQGGQENFDGIIAVNASVLPDLLELTGPVYLEEFNKEFKSEDVLYELEYEVERKYIERGISLGQRKTIFKELVKEVLNKLTQKSIWEQSKLKDLVLSELNKKNILIFIKDIKDQKLISEFNWSGEVNSSYQNDYLMINEANFNARKSNYFVKREIEYFIDLNKEKPEVNLKIKYIHQGKEKDWFNWDYQAYLRVYVPLGSELISTNNVNSEAKFFEDLGKIVFGHWIIIPTGQEKTIELTYTLPKHIIKEKDYRILVQKQSGVDNLLFKIILKNNQKEYIKDEIINKDWEGIISF